MKSFRRGDIVLIDVPIVDGSRVQGGNRPWLIVQNDVGNRHSPTTIVVPLTSKLKRMEMPTHVIVTGKGIKASMVECEQVRVIDKARVKKCICTLSPQIMSYVDKALKNAFFYGGGCSRWRMIRNYALLVKERLCVARNVRGGMKTLRLVRCW